MNQDLSCFTIEHREGANGKIWKRKPTQNQAGGRWINELGQVATDSRENTSRSTWSVPQRQHHSRVVLWVLLFEALVLVAMTLGQIYYLKMFFEVRR
ncbi:hypothetical protein CRUP_003755, partial [Coryphaenoides rupestris]